MLIGYGRVSTRDQNPDHQIDALTRAGVTRDNLYIDYVSGARASRPEWDKVRAALREGDTLVCTRLDRLGRSMKELVNLGDELRSQGIGLKVLEQGIDTSTSEGRAMFGMFAVFAELQRDLIAANTRDGLTAARARGRAGGRKPKLTAEQVRWAQQAYDAREKTVAQIAAFFAVKRTTVYNHLDTSKQPEPSGTDTGTADRDDTPAAASTQTASPVRESPPLAEDHPARETRTGKKPEGSGTAARQRRRSSQRSSAASKAGTTTTRVRASDFDGNPYGLERGTEAGVWRVTENGTRLGTVHRRRSLTGRSASWEAWTDNPYMPVSKRNYDTRAEAALAVLKAATHRS